MSALTEEDFENLRWLSERLSKDIAAKKSWGQDVPNGLTMALKSLDKVINDRAARKGRGR